MSPIFGTRFKDETLLFDFKRCIQEKFGKKYGNIEKELSKAMKLYLATENYKDYPTKISILPGAEGVQTEVTKTHNFSKRQKNLIREFEKIFLFEDVINDKELRNLIKTTLNIHDYRSVNNSIDFLVLNGFIEKRYGNWLNISNPYAVDEEIFSESLD
jgi:hypothetical protein